MLPNNYVTNISQQLCSTFFKGILSERCFGQFEPEVRMIRDSCHVPISVNGLVDVFYDSDLDETLGL